MVCWLATAAAATATTTGDDDTRAVMIGNEKTKDEKNTLFVTNELQEKCSG